MTNENVVISKTDIVINKELEYKSRNYYFVTDRSITGEITVLSESKKTHKFNAKDACEYFIMKLDKCFMYEGYEYYDNTDSYYKRAYNSTDKIEISFEEYIEASIKWEFYKIK